MKENFRHIAWVLMLCLLLTPVSAQTRKQGVASPKPAARTAVKEPAPTFDTLLAADSYTVYVEVRSVGQFVRSPGINNVLDPILKLADPPKEFRTLIKWLNQHAEELMSSRMMCASLPHRPKLPQFLCAIEFSSEEDAQKFEPQLRTFLPKLLPTPTPTPSPHTADKSTAPGEQTRISKEPLAPAAPPAAPPYVITQAGSLVLIGATAINFKDLKHPNSKLLAEDADFSSTRNRFSSEPVFAYFDVRALRQEDEERRRKNHENYERSMEEHRKMQAEIARQAQNNGESSAPISIAETESFEASEPEIQSDVRPELVIVEASPSPSPEAKRNEEATEAIASLGRAFFAGQSKWPDAVAAAITFDEESYNLRVLLINPPETKAVIIPFLPTLFAGPPISSAAASVLPADSDLFVTLSLDWNLIHDNMIKTAIEQHANQNRNVGLVLNEAPATTEPGSPFAAYEKLLGINFKEELIPLLGSEIALSLRRLHPQVAEPKPSPDAENGEKKPPTEPSGPVPVVAIAIRDREAVKKLLPRIIESISFKGAGMLAQTERREGTELVSYANVLSYAFIADFLVVSTDSSVVRTVVDAYLKNETLGSNSKFRNFTRWQPRQVLGQVYVPSETVDSYNGFSPQAVAAFSQSMQEFLTGLGPVNDPVTFALSNEISGPFYELHVPRSVLLLTLAAITGTSALTAEPNEMAAQLALRMIASAESTYISSEGAEGFGTLEQLISAKLIAREVLQSKGYQIDLRVSGKTFEASAVPIEYGKTGKISYFIDQSFVLRGGDHGGGPATVADKPAQ